MKGLSRVLRRLVWGIAIIVGVTFGSWLLVVALPGDPARLLVGPRASDKDVASVKAIYGLDQPAPIQLARYVRKMVHLAPGAGTDAKEHAGCAEPIPHVHVDLGQSYFYQRPVTALVAKKLPLTLELALGALFVQILVGGGAGLLAAARPRSKVDEAAVASSLLVSAVPLFALALALQYVFAYRLGVLPFEGAGKTPLDRVLSLILPSVALGIYGSALFARIVREEVGHSLQSDHVRTALAKGASRARVVVVHALRAALVPIATLAALDLGGLVGGAIVVEKVFGLPGLGEMTVNAVQNRDAPAVVGSVLVSSTALVLATIAADALAVMLDPRLRRER